MVRCGRALAVSLACLSVGGAAEDWAVLVAGSNGYWNYRHQADVCHAYKTLTKSGFNPDRIITMIYDDAAKSDENPYKGKLFNKPAATLADAVDVYEGCKKDYVGADVNPDKFVAVLTGDEKVANGPVLKSTAEDNVFVNFVDHGGVHLIAFPDGADVLHANRLISTLESMHAKGMYKQLVFYLETCESGSMFEGLLKPELPVYALTAANARESSWGTYCGDDATVGGKSLGTCLGDLFSVNWMQDSDLKAAGETLGTQYLKVKNLTDKSHVMRYGQVSAFENEPIADFQGGGLGLVSSLQAAPAGHALQVDSREAKLHMLYKAFLQKSSAEASDRLIREVRERQGVHAMGKAIAGKVLGDSHAAEMLAAPLREDFSWTPSGASCHELAVRGFSRSCGWTENRLVLSKTLRQLCDRTEHDPAPILAALDAACGASARVQPPLWT